MTTEAETDLYGDLDEASLAKKPKQETRKNTNPPLRESTQAAACNPIGCSAASAAAASTGPAEPMTLHGLGKMYDEPYVSELSSRIEAISKENDNLKRNMGTLYRTAVRELQRKDEAIMRLQDEVDGKVWQRSDSARVAKLLERSET